MSEQQRKLATKALSRRGFLRAVGGIGLGATVAALGASSLSRSGYAQTRGPVTLADLEAGVQKLQEILAQLGGTVQVNPDEVIRSGRIDVNLFFISSEDIRASDGKSKRLEQLDGVVIGVLSTPIPLQAELGTIPDGFSVMRVRKSGENWEADFFQSSSTIADATLRAILPAQKDLPPPLANAPVMPAPRSFNGPAAGAVGLIALGPPPAMFLLKRA